MTGRSGLATCDSRLGRGDGVQGGVARHSAGLPCRPACSPTPQSTHHSKYASHSHSVVLAMAALPPVARTVARAAAAARKAAAIGNHFPASLPRLRYRYNQPGAVYSA